MKIQSIAPTRIDLAGGTVDLWPLYLFIKQPEGPSTINLGINLFAETICETLPHPLVILESQDLSTRLEFKWNELEQVKSPPSLILHLKFLRYFAQVAQKNGRFNSQQGLKISTRALSPAGAGLGGSSTLSVSMIGALRAWATGDTSPQTEGESLIELVRDIETVVIRVPAGLQDYYGAMYGGLQELKWRPRHNEREPFNFTLIQELQKRLILFYSGQSRNSGINNWALFKALIDQQSQNSSQHSSQLTSQLFEEIAQATEDLKVALLQQNYTEVGKAIDREWKARRQLAPGISTPEIDQAFRSAKQLGANAGKICGAGGGGCFFIYTDNSDAQHRQSIIDAVEAIPGIRHLPFEGVSHGVKVTLL